MASVPIIAYQTRLHAQALTIEHRFDGAGDKFSIQFEFDRVIDSTECPAGM